MYQWELKKINLKFKTVWKINGGSANKKTNDFIVIRKNGCEGWGEISASTKDNDLKQITSDLANINLNKLQNLNEIYNLNVCPQVIAGLEMAWIHLQCKLKKISISDELNIKPCLQSSTSFSIPILSPDETIKYMSQFNIQRFQSCKLKIKGPNSLQILNLVANNFKGPIRIDANESFKNASEVLDFLERTADINIQLLEQPLNRSNLNEAEILKPQVSIPIVGDESIQNNDVNSDYLKYFHGLNIKLMKAGGYKQAIKQLNQCRALGLKTMVGCMVETSLNISSALNISANCDWLDLDGYLLLEEDPFSLLTEKLGIVYRN